MGKKLISKADFGRYAGVSPATVTRLAVGRLKDAVTGHRVDLDHPCVIEYITEREDAQAKLPPPAPGVEDAKPSYVRGKVAGKETRKKESMDNLLTGGKTIQVVPDEIKDFGNMTLNEIVAQFGTEEAFVDWLKATKSIEDINEKRLKNAATRGELVSRDLVRLGVIEPVEAAHLKLLTDGAKTIAKRVTAMNGAGRSLEEVEAFVVDNISSFIKPIKAKTRKALDRA